MAQVHHRCTSKYANAGLSRPICAAETSPQVSPPFVPLLRGECRNCLILLVAILMLPYQWGAKNGMELIEREHMKQEILVGGADYMEAGGPQGTLVPGCKVFANWSVQLNKLNNLSVLWTQCLACALSGGLYHFL